MSRSVRVLLAATLAAGLFELASAPLLEVPAAPAAIGAIFLLAALSLYRRPGLGPALVLGLAFLVELAGLPFYERNSVADRIVQMGFGALSLVGLIAALGVVLERRRARAPRRGVAYSSRSSYVRSVGGDDHHETATSHDQRPRPVRARRLSRRRDRLWR